MPNQPSVSNGIPLAIAMIDCQRAMGLGILTKINVKTASTATREINPDSATRVRPMLSSRVKQTMLVPRVLLNKACSSAVQVLPLDIITSQLLIPKGKSESVWPKYTNHW
jgi:hypothetical protein